MARNPPTVNPRTKRVAKYLMDHFMGELAQLTDRDFLKWADSALKEGLVPAATHKGWVGAHRQLSRANELNPAKCRDILEHNMTIQLRWHNLFGKQGKSKTSNDYMGKLIDGLFCYGAFMNGGEEREKVLWKLSQRYNRAPKKDEPVEEPEVLVDLGEEPSVAPAPEPQGQMIELGDTTFSYDIDGPFDVQKLAQITTMIAYRIGGNYADVTKFALALQPFAS